MKKKNMAGAIGSVMFVMIASRLLALLSSQIYMSVFGTDSIYINIYSYAINIPNIIFTCIGTALSTVVIPLYVGHKAVGEHQKAKEFADNILTISTVLTLIVVVISVAISPVLVRFTGFSKNEASGNYAIKSLMIVMPVMIFYAWNYVFQGMLQAEGKYWLPAFVSAPSSLVVIAYVLFLSDRFGVMGLLVATIIGLALQAFILIPSLMNTGYRYKPRFKLRDSDIIKAGKMTIPVLIGVGSYQINMLFNSTMIARYDEGMVTIITFVQNITIQLVVSLSYSVTSVLYPKLSESAAKEDMAGYKETLSSILKIIVVLLVPVTAGYISVREPLLDILVSWGKVSQQAVNKAEIFLSLYAIGVIGIGLKEILDRAFYSLKDTRTSAINGFFIMAVNIVLTISLMSAFGAYGIPLAYSLASIIGIINLLWQLRRKIGSYAPGLAMEFIKSVFCAVIMAVVVVFAIKGLNMAFVGNNLIYKVFRFAVPVIAGVIVYGVSGYILGVDSIRVCAGKVIDRFKS